MTQQRPYQIIADLQDEIVSFVEQRGMEAARGARIRLSPAGLAAFHAALSPLRLDATDVGTYVELDVGRLPFEVDPDQAELFRFVTRAD